MNDAKGSATTSQGGDPHPGRTAMSFNDDAELGERVALIELLHGVLDRGVYISGDVVVSVAGIDLLYVGLRVLLSSVETLEASGRTGAMENGKAES